MSTDNSDLAVCSEQRRDVSRALERLPSSQRDALWLAYVEGLSHEEISGILGMKTASIKILLFRARRKMIQLLKGHKR
jgi:RNA polymerase sigma-70 factor (ECF subfamily)